MSVTTPPSRGATDHRHDVDWVVVGSGFGGSVAALRLAEKGYRVAVLERGRSYADADLPTAASNSRRFLWAPSVGLRGIMRNVLFRHVFTSTQTGVGGGSGVYFGEPGRTVPDPYFGGAGPDRTGCIRGGGSRRCGRDGARAR